MLISPALWAYTMETYPGTLRRVKHVLPALRVFERIYLYVHFTLNMVNFTNIYIYKFWFSPYKDVFSA